MKQIRKRLTYANVVSSIALFLVLGGATALAAGLAKNSVGSKQIKKNAVTSAKIKNNAVTTAKIKNGAITGAKVNLGSLGTVPNAAHATNADSAGSAGNAGNANTVGGHSVSKVFAKIPTNTTTTLGTFGTFKISATCDAATNISEIEVDPQSTDSDYAAFGDGPGGAYFEREQGAEPNSADISDGNERGIVTFSGAQSGGAVVTGTLAWDDSASFQGENVCAVYGYFTS
ncbi:MAG TPA: hypothetical protein VFU16_07585 [Solirubrobacterales bacterium]|nr:hypothetical protein [Solirubrobacterales bacterium]